MSDRNQEPSEAAGPASGGRCRELRRDSRSAEQLAEGVPPTGQRGAESQPGQEQAAGTERGSGDTTDRVDADDSAGRAADQDRDQRGGAGAEAAGQTATTGSAEGGQRGEGGQRDEGGEGRTALFAEEERDRLGEQWGAVQAAFVDDPRAAVERADALVVEVVQILTTSFTDERSRLEQQWSQGEDVSTEELRQALHRYRSFFERLLHV